VDQFESKQRPQRPIQASSPTGDNSPLSEKASKLNLNVPPKGSPVAKNTEAVKDAVVLSSPKRLSKGSAADQQFAQQMSKDQEFLDRATILVRELTVHPVGGKARDNERLAVDKQRLDQVRDVRKAADVQATRIQQGLEVDKQQVAQQQKQQQKLGNEAERAVQGASQESREKGNTEKPNNSQSVTQQQVIKDSLQRDLQLKQDLAIAARELADKSENSKVATALSERSASKEGTLTQGTQDLVRGMGDGGKIPERADARLPQVQELSTGAILAVSLTTIEKAHSGSGPLQETIRSEEKRVIQQRPNNSLEPSVVIEVEEDELDERSISRRRFAARVTKRMKAKLKRQTPLERRKARLKAERERRLRRRRYRNTLPGN